MSTDRPTYTPDPDVDEHDGIGTYQDDNALEAE